MYGIGVGRQPVLLMETGVNAVTALGTKPGWVSGDVASLAASASINCIFDLGPDFDQYVAVAIKVNPAGPSSGLSAVQVFGSDTAGVNANRRFKDISQPGPATINAAITVATGCSELWVRPHGRIVVVSVTNADGVNALGAGSKISLSAYPA